MPWPGIGANVMATTRQPIMTTDTMPLGASTDSVDSPACRGRRIDITKASAASGMEIAKPAPHQAKVSSQPPSTGPRAEAPAPMPDHSAMARVRSRPANSAVIIVSVVG